MTTEYQIGIVNDEPRLLGLVYLERGEYWQRLNDSEAALVEYARCAAVTTDNELAKRANSKLDQLIGTNQGRYTSYRSDPPTNDCFRTYPRMDCPQIAVFLRKPRYGDFLICNREVLPSSTPSPN